MKIEMCNMQGAFPQEVMSHIETIRRAKDVNSFYDSLMSSRHGGKIQYSRNGDILTREIRIKQGRLKGVVREFKTKKLKNVETYLGIPYAAAPVKSLRFMPPGSPPSWKDVKIFDSFSPVCPQNPPDLTHEPFKTMNAGYYNRLKGLVPFLSNQSEDCLYLNIYAPVQDWKLQKKHPVIVYIHGESFEWNSGNPYDGSVLASYGNVVVVTINFRLGILGFLRPGLSEHTISNFGLLDQIAALQWIKDNINEFGGDSTLVTLMGHGSGAACINFLMVSPVSMASQGLFHKAILMSGTALADWALTHNPLQSTIQVAEALNCPLVDKNDELSNCLRRKRLSEIMSVKISVPEFQTPFGPIVDGSVVPNTPQQVMGIYQSLFTRYELLYGITEWDSYHILDPVSLTYGMLEGERNDFLRKYMYSRYEALPYFALATTLSQYFDWRKAIPPSKSAAEEHRDLVLDLLSDARFVSPVIQMALYHSKINPKSYLYVFLHKSKMGEFAGSQRSISGEEISYVFGIPLLNEERPLSHHKFSLSEQLLSEHILTYFTNFAKTGNPNAPRRMEFVTQGPSEWQHHDLYWPEYDSINQSYLALGIPPYVGHHYKSQMIQYWNEILPDLLSNPTKLKQQKPELSTEHLRNASYQPSTHFGTPYAKEDSSPWAYGVVRGSPKDYNRGKKPEKQEEDNSSFKQMDRPQEDTETSNPDSNMSFAAIPYFVAISVCLLIINVVVIWFYCYKKRKLQERGKTITKESPTVACEGVRRKSSCADNVYSIVECSDRSRSSKPEKPVRLKKYLNSENQAKVKKWILEKYSKNRKNSEVRLDTNKATKSNSVLDESIRLTAMPKPILKNSTKIYRSSEDLKIKKNVEKISVGIDATPSTRGESVLKQTPIEITKSLDRGLKIGPGDSLPRRSRTSVSLQMLPMKGDLKFVSPEPEIVKLRQEPQPGSSKTLQTFQADVNVTSRDSDTEQEKPYTDPLENIQRRNFPKVLPDYPESRNKPNPPPPPPRVSTLRRKNSEERKLKDDDSSQTDSSKASVIQKTPTIIIKPKIGPKKHSLEEKNKKAHINLQRQKKSKTPPRVLDSKGPSDKKPKSFQI